MAYWKRHAPLALVVVATLALGVGAATAVYAVVEALIVRSMPVRDPASLVWMWNARVERDRAPFSAPDLADYRSGNNVLEGLAPFVNWTANLTGLGDAERLEGVRVAPEFFDLLGVTMRLGRTFTAADARAQVVVLGDRIWRRRFAAERSIVGQTVWLNGSGYTVVGVLPPGFVFPFRDAEIAVPLSLESDPRRGNRGAGFLRVVARLKPGTSIAGAKANLDAIGARLRRDYPDTNAKKLGVNLFPLHREIVGEAGPLLITLLAAVVLLLLVACANLANLLLVTMTARRRELSVRTALGATRRRLAFQLLGEVVVVVAAGGAIGLVFGRTLADALVWWGAATLPHLNDVSLTPGVIGFAIVATLLAAVLCGAGPVWFLSAAPAAGLNEDGRGSSASSLQSRWRRVFVAGQIAVTLVLLVGMALTVRSFNRLQAVTAGFDGEHVLSIQLALPPARYATVPDIITFAEAFDSEVKALPGVRDAAAISLLPLSGLLSTQDYRIVGKPEPLPNDVPQAHYRIVMPGYFRIMGIALQGREFDHTDRERTRRVAIISRTLWKRHWGDQSPLGEHLVVGGDALEIIGVCDDVKQFSLDATATADLYVPLRQMPAGQSPFMAARMYWVAQTDREPMYFADSIRAAVRRRDKDVAASSIRPMSQVLSASIGARRFNADLIEIAGAASFLLALMGVYSVASFSMARRVREIGIRLTLGARPTQVVLSMVATEWPAIAVGLVAGVAGGFAVGRALASVLFAPDDVALAVLVTAVTLGSASLVASYLPARRAAGADPMAALRREL
jgi:putative ABC transport system permease protein